MPRGQYDRSKARKSGEKSKPATQALAVVAPEALKGSGWFDKLNSAEQATVQDEGRKLATALINHGVSRLAIGEHLANLRSILEPHNVFGKFLRNFHFSKRTAYRYIAGYENAKARLPEKILKTAMARGINIVGDTNTRPLGVYTEAVATLPPPPAPSDEQASAWLDQVEAVRKTRPAGATVLAMPEVPQDPDTLLKECYRFVSSRYKKLPNNHKTRGNWMRSLVGMMLTELGSASQTFSSVAIPEGYKAERGRPRFAASA